MSASDDVSDELQLPRLDLQSTLSAGPSLVSSVGPSGAIFEKGEILRDEFEIVGAIGAGGMGHVFEAHDLLLDRRVAVKTMRPGIAPGRLREEARAMAAVRHPSMVSVYCMGTHRGIDYVVMERLYGVTLDAHLAQRWRAREIFTVAEVVELLRGLADGLVAIHSAGISHRDIKPENVMLAQHGRIVLMDLGIVVAEVNAGTNSKMEGTPAYMAPEVIANTMHAGHGSSADLYAAGVIAFEMLAGHIPFGGRTPTEILGRHLQEKPPDLRTLRADVPAPLARLIAELLHKDPAARPSGAEELRWTLDSLARRPSAAPLAADPAPDVLIVDDDPTIATSLATLVRAAVPAVRVRIARDGEDALREVRAAVPDLMVLDIDMPRMNGIEVCMHMQALPERGRCKIISLSGSADVHDRELLRQLGVSMFVAKEPAQLEYLPALVLEALGPGRPRASA